MSCRLFVAPESLTAGSRIVTGDDYRYLFRVRRLGVGDEVTLFDGAGCEAAARVQSVSAEQAVLAVDEPRRVAEPARCRLTVVQALIKGERMDWCLQKLVELGVAEVIPVRTERTVVKLDAGRARKRHARYLDIARHAARQSRRARVPRVHEVTDLPHALAQVSACETKWVLWEREQGQGLGSALEIEPPASICVLVGPEGGFTAAEVEQAVAGGFTSLGLGPYILRAETAAVAVAAAVGVAFGDLAGADVAE